MVHNDSGAEHTLAPPSQSAMGGLAPAQAGHPALNIEDRDDIAMRVRAWFAEAMAHPLWKDWSVRSKESTGFYVGVDGGGWSKDGQLTDYQNLIDAKRPAVSINHIQAVVDYMSGAERSGRSDVKASPIGDEDADAAELMTFFLKYAQDQCDCEDLLSEVFDEGVITGMHAAKVGIDYDDADHPTGAIALESKKPYSELIWDPYWSRQDMSDCRYMIEYRWVFRRDLMAAFPEHRTEIETAVGELRLAREGFGTSGSGDAYGSVRGHPILGLDDVIRWYSDEDQLLVAEAWYQAYFPRFRVLDKTTNTYRDCETHAEAKRLEDSDPERLKLYRTEVKKIRMATIVPGTYQVLEEDKAPFEGYDDQAYPYCVYVAKRKGDYIYGAVENLKDPQRIENKRWSQTIEILTKFTNMRLLIPRGSLMDPNAFANPADTSPVFYDPEKIKQGEGIRWLAPPIGEMARVLMDVALQMKMNIREVSGINTDLLGIRSDDASGIAIRHRQAQGQTIATLFFDNFRKFRRLVGERLARRVQQVYTFEDTVRLTNRYGTPIMVQINPQELQGKKMDKEEFRKFQEARLREGKPLVLRSLDSLKFDITISDAPSTPTARAGALVALLEIMKTIEVPAIRLALTELMLELSDIPRREEALARVRPIIAAITGQVVPPPAPGGPGGPGQPPPPGGAMAPPPTPPPMPAAQAA